MLNNFFTRIREYLYYNKIERNGVFALIVLLCLFYLGLSFYETIIDKQTVSNIDFFAKIDSLEKASLPIRPHRILFDFNPNTVEEKTLGELGFSQRQIQNILNYRKAGGYFSIKTDFKKLYFVTDSIYDIYSSYLNISSQNMKKSYRGKKAVWAKKKKVSNHQKETRKDSLFAFNPNTISKKEWLLLGVPEKHVLVIQNYLSKGGHFWKKEDLKKIYGFPDRMYLRLEDSISIPPQIYREAQKVLYDLNTVTETELIELRVSKSMIRKVLKYRQKLGGYAQMSQLLEIYNLTDWDLKQLKKYCTIQSFPQKININIATASELYRHPYLDYRTAHSILRYRKRKGNYANIQVLKEAKILTDKVFEKMKFYLDVKN